MDRNRKSPNSRLLILLTSGLAGLRLGTWDSFLWICVHTDATHIWALWCHEHNQMSDVRKQIRWNDLNGHCWGIKQTVEFKFISILSYSNFQRCFKVISLSLMVGESGNYWKLAIWGFCNWRKFNYKVELNPDCSETGLFCVRILDSIWGLTLVWTWQHGMVLTLK